MFFRCNNGIDVMSKDRILLLETQIEVHTD